MRLVLLAILGSLGLASPVAGAEGAVVKTDNVEARLVAERNGVAPGETIHVALHKIIRPRWHTYWRNPGDAGEPTRIEWTLPEGFSAGDIVWPLPKAIQLEGVLTNYGFEGALVLPVPITAPKDLAAGEAVTLKAFASWLVCEDICIPEEAELAITLQALEAPGAPDARWAKPIAAVLAATPRDEGFQAGLSRQGEAVRLAVAHPSLAAAIAEDRLRKPAFFPYLGTVIDHNAPQPAALRGAGLALDLKHGFALEKELVAVAGALVFEEKGESGWSRRGVEITATPGADPLDGAAAPAQAPPGGGARAASGADAPGPAKPLGGGPARSFFDGGGGLLGYLIGAFLGGLLLNLMPCVFPVLSIKALSLVNKAHGAPAAARAQGLAFLAGVLATFLGLAGALLAFKAAGAQIGWGFQLQSPVVVALLALVMFAIGLNLLGWFEIGASVQGMGAGLAAQGGLAGAFFTGVLAVAVAAPCTAPFMAGALGFALVQPAPVALAVFAALGLGLAAPFVLLAFAPALGRMLPRPGAWMVRFKEILAFPMLGAAAWLVWVLAEGRSGAMGVAAALAAMLAFAFAVWLFKTTAQARGAWPILGRAGGLAGIAAALALAAAPAALAPTAAAAAGAAAGVWSPDKVAQLRAEGKAVFVDFTAAWCITCQVNKKIALETKRVQAAFAAKGVTFLTADWTDRDPVIAAALSEHGRSGVPLYLLYPAAGGEPMVLPQLLTEGLVIDAIERAAG